MIRGRPWNLATWKIADVFFRISPMTNSFIYQPWYYPYSLVPTLKFLEIVRSLSSLDGLGDVSLDTD
jgi:hypothetical protein